MTAALSIENGSLFEGESEFEKLKIYLITLVSIRSDWEDLPWLFRSVEYLVSNKDGKNKGNMPTEMELVLYEYTQQGACHEVFGKLLKGVWKNEKNVKIKGVKKKPSITPQAETRSIHMLLDHKLIADIEGLTS
ncbi:hypothetical protein Tco_0625966 [Tanacetum coccineum]|uniref:Uncharacterized protein n=1 Tax=Tanacetum coccineum TaxID=301880 RepID=A0ABQ4WIF1_9ASTR